MSRLAEAEQKLAAALDTLEAALKAKVDAADQPDNAAIITEIGRIDEQLSQAMKLIADIQRSGVSEGGNA
jgi:molecular chaperone GrpE (heat shock protein)